MGDRLCQGVVLLLSSAPARYRDGLDNATLLGLGRWAAFEIIDVVQLFPYGRRSGVARAGPLSNAVARLGRLGHRPRLLDRTGPTVSLLCLGSLTPMTDGSLES